MEPGIIFCDTFRIMVTVLIRKRESTCIAHYSFFSLAEGIQPPANCNVISTDSYIYRCRSDVMPPTSLVAKFSPNDSWIQFSRDSKIIIQHLF